MAPVFVYITVPSRQEAEAIARALLEERLAAGVNLIPGVHSLYRWKGRVEEGEEVALMAKTTEALIDPLTRKVQALHPYQVPCIAALPVVGGSEAYFAWIGHETRPAAGASA